jgi:hypothetical protein
MTFGATIPAKESDNATTIRLESFRIDLICLDFLSIYAGFIWSLCGVYMTFVPFVSSPSIFL